MRKFGFIVFSAALALLLIWKRERVLMAIADITPWDEHFKDAGEKYGFPPELLKAIAKKESDYDPAAVSPVGAQGLMQFMPATAAERGGFDPFDPVASIYAAAAYLASIANYFRRQGLPESVPYLLAAYNWGMGNVARKGLENAPAETRDYVTKITRWAGIEFTPPENWA